MAWLGFGEGVGHDKGFEYIFGNYQFLFWKFSPIFFDLAKFGAFLHFLGSLRLIFLARWDYFWG